MNSESFTLKEILGIFLVVLLFLLAAHFSQAYKESLQSMILLEGIVGMALYVFATIVAVVVAPIGTLPLLPVAAALWGSAAAALLSIFGWIIGGVIAFVLAREYGRPLVGKLVNLERADNISEAVVGKNPFWMIMFLRMVIPVDILSYAIGLFVSVPILTYTIATIIGVMPFAFIFSYAAVLPLVYQVGVFILAVVIVLVSYWRIQKFLLHKK